MLVFSKRRYLKNNPQNQEYASSPFSWQTECDRKKVIFDKKSEDCNIGRCGVYPVFKEDCVKVKKKKYMEESDED